MLLVDAANVIGSRPNGWWRDRPGAARSFVQQIREGAVSGRIDTPVVVVLEGASRKGMDEGLVDRVTVVHAPGSGDDALIAVASESDTPVRLVTADRELSARAVKVGAEVVGPKWLLSALDD
jgi:uncharacterized protein YaiI (UPF0178 family)